MGMADVSGVLYIVLVTLLCLSDHLGVSAETGRKKRSLLPEQPRIITQDGHLVFQSGINHNITFKAGSGGGFLLNNVDLMATVNQTQRTKRDVDMLKTAFGSGTNNLTYRVSTLEGRVNSILQTSSHFLPILQTVPNLARRVNQQNSRLTNVESRFPIGSSMSTINGIISNVTARVQALENAHQQLVTTETAEATELHKIVTNLQRTVQTIQTLLTTDECASNPCQNGGTCRDMYNAYYCQCAPQWQGPECTQDVNECYIYHGTDLGCQNGATCQNLPGSYRCQCPPNFFGTHCRLTHDDCSRVSNSELCDHGTCVNVERAATGQARYTCICDEGWTTSDSSPACSVDVNECNGPRHCSVDPPVQCINYPGGYHCGHCPAGYNGNGFYCHDINECASNSGVCFHQCQNTIGSFVCGPCPSGYSGDGRTCTYIGVCASDNGGCYPLATCFDNGIVRTGCACPDGYAGNGIGPNGCAVINVAGACSSNPCQNQGVCTPGAYGQFFCQCAPGFQGPTCSQTANACDNNPCQNGGICSPLPGGNFACNCFSNFTGLTCEQEQQACGGLLTGLSGSFRYPGNPGVSYDHNLDCSWTITTPDNNKVLRLIFQNFHLEHHPSCSYDSLHIYDGESGADPSIGTYCGNTIPQINSTGPHLYLRFVTDNSESRDGFQASWTSHEPGCGGHLVGDSGNITSPGWPTQDYSNNLDCVWTIAVTPGNNIRFTFGHLALGHHSSCNFDHLEILDGETATAPSLGKYCSTGNPNPITTTGPYAYVHFHTDDSYGDGGFHITYQISDNQGCGEAFEADSGVVQTPNYPSPYTQALQCVWTITTQPYSKVQLTFSNLDLQSTSGCTNNYLQIRDGLDQTANLLQTVCEDTTPILASGNVLFLELYSDGAMTGSGFQASWTAVCGGVYTELSGVIVSPGWPNSHPSNQDCIYQITVPELHRVVLNITQMHLEESSNGCFDYLEFYDGADTSAHIIDPRLCGPLTARIIRSTGESLTVKFHSDSSVERDGFRAVYQAEEASGEPQCGAVINPGGTATHFYRSAGTNTPPGTSCVWHVTVAPGLIIRLNLYSIHFPPFSNGTCGAAGLTVEDMIPDGAALVPSPFGTFCGHSRQVFTSTSNQITLRMTAQENSAAQYFFATYTTQNASADCGAALTSSSGVIESPNYPNDYPHNINCVWTITVPQGQQIRLNVTDFHLEPHSSCFYDALEVRNGGFSTSPLLKRFCANELEFTPVTSFSNRLFIKFTTDGSVSDRGFSINYDSAISGCGGAMTTQTGAFVSPNYPQNYPHNVECFYTITVSEGSNIVLSFDAFDIEYHYRCGYDYLKVREGSVTGTLLANLCGSEIPSPIMSTSNKLWIVYRTDFSDAGAGFSAQYRANCNRNITGRSGVIESPNYPSAYPNHSNCTWIIRAPPGNKIKASFATMNLEDHSSCAYDSVTLRDGSSTSASTLVGPLCRGTVIPNDVTTTGNALTIQFVSDGSVPDEGFRLEWIAEGCGGTLTASSGTLTTPGYPDAYPNSVLVLCEWTIQVPVGKRVQLNITDFNLEFHSGCSDNYLDIYAGPDESGPKISHLCTGSMPHTGQNITSSGNSMFVRFSATPGYVSGRGFSISYTTIDGGCGGHFSALSSNIFSPNYPNEYDNNMECEYQIQVASGHTVELTFNAFNVEGHYDHVTLYDGTTVNAPEIARLHGSVVPTPASFKSSNNTMLVRFFSDYSITYPGFNATYRTACGGTLNADVDGIISSPHSSVMLTTCIWHIISQIPTRRVSLTFTHFLIEGFSDGNYVALADGLDISDFEYSYSGTVLPPMHTSRSSALTVVMNVTSFSNANFRALYTTADNACGGRTQAPSGRFMSPGYPDPYPANTECVWQISTAPGNSFSLTFQQFQLVGGVYDDYVEIYTPDINGENLGRWYGDSAPPSMTQMSGIWIKFRSNHDESQGQGFQAQWIYNDFNALTGDQGQIGSPGLSYLPNMDLRWTITVDEGKRIRLTFNSFNLAAEFFSTMPSMDYLNIFDGAESDGVTLGMYDGARLPDPVESVNNVVSLVFHTDGHSQASGFLLTWQAIVHDTSAASNGTTASGCGTYLTATHTAQNFTSPNYPSNYPLNVECKWVITAPEGKRIELDFLQIDVEGHRHTCPYDFVKVFDGNENGTVIGTFCGRDIPAPITSDFSVLVVQFLSDYSVRRSGFVIQYKQACGGFTTDPIGTIQSPGFPQSYPDSLNCLFNVMVPLDRTIHVTFNSPFNIVQSSSGNCSDDYLQLFNGMDVTGPPLISNSGPSHPNGRYCGTTVPSGVVETSTNFLTAKFISDNSSSDNGAGFSFNYTERHFACGGQYRLTNQISSGYFTSPNYPQDYPQNVDCKWVIVAPPSSRVQIDFEGDFYIEPGSNGGCEFDYIEFHDGGTVVSPRLGERACGDHLPSSVISTGNHLMARFRTDNSITHVGFKARYSIATCGGRIVVGTDLRDVTSPNYPQSYDPNLDCFWVLQGPVGHFLTINLVDFNVQSSPGCTADRLEIMDPATAPLNYSNSQENPEMSVAVQGLSIAQARANYSGNQLFSGCGTLHSLQTFTTADNRAYIWFKSDGSLSSDGFRIQAAASSEECGGDMLLSSGVISSPNFPHTYPHSRRCIWKIKVPVGRKIKLTFTDFALESPINSGRCIYDFVEVYNGILAISPTLGLYCGTTRPGPVSSSANTMMVIFRADSSYTHGGFRAEYTSDEEADCGGRREISGRLNFTAYGSSSHAHNLQCVWQIENRQINSSMKFRFTGLDLEYHPGCQYDFVMVKEGVDYSAPTIGRFCGNRSTNWRQFRRLWNGLPQFVIPSPNAWVAFFSDPSIAQSGFRLEYTFEPCGGVLTESSGVITSPNYPDNYPINVDCAWLIRAPEGMVIKVNVTDFLFERHSSCHFDFLVIQNGGSYDSPKIGQYCHDQIIPFITSQSNEVRMVMSTDGSVPGRGFRLEYSFSHPGCGGHLSKLQGNLSSPNHPSSYPDNVYCIWDINVEQGYFVSLIFKPPFDVACPDSVRVYTVEDNGSTTELGSYCHIEVPPRLNSTTHRMRVVFQSDGSTNGVGFEAHYTSGCGGEITADQAMLTSPGFPGYENNMRCLYFLNPGGDKSLSIRFIQFQLEGGAGCPSDYLRIYQGNSTSGSRLANLCSDITPGKVIGRGSMLLDFKTDSSHTYRGYKAYYKAEACGGVFTRDSFYIKTPNFPSNYLDNLNCIFNITVDEQKVILFRFRNFDVQASTNCNADYLSIYDGSTLQAPRLGKLCGSLESIPTQFKTTSNTLIMNFVTNYAVNKKGFSGSYTSSYGPAVGCGGTLEQATGTIQSLDIDGNNKYENNLDCDWNIVVGADKIVVINITNFVLEDYMPTCPYDYVQIYDGPTKDSPPLFKRCGVASVPIVLRSSSNNVLLNFRTDPSVVRDGFNITFYEEDRLCGGFLNATDEVQNLTSVGYPSPADQILRCQWTVDSGSDIKQVKFSLEDFQLGTDCQAEYLQIFDNPLGMHGMRQKVCFPTSIPHIFYTHRRQGVVIYHQESTTSPGFRLTYQRSGCSRVYTTEAGWLTTPNYPGVYHHHLNCNIQIFAPNGTFLSFYFKDFHLESGGSSCHFDQLVVAGGNFTSPPLCGNTLPGSIHLFSPNATVTLTTDYSVSYVGYAITYVASTVGPGCGGNLSHAIPGYITSPQYPSPPQGPLECTWNIAPARRLLLKLTVSGGPAQQSGYCGDTYVEINSRPYKWIRQCRPIDRTIRVQGDINIKYVVPAGNITAPTFTLYYRYLDATRERSPALIPQYNWWTRMGLSHRHKIIFSYG